MNGTTAKPRLVRLWPLAWALALWLVEAPHAAAQGTWLHTQCLAGAGTQTPCKAPPAWGQTGTDYVQALATAAGPGNLGVSLVKPETLPAANAARAQLAAVMLAYLDNSRPLVNYRWYGPVAAAAVSPRRADASAQRDAAERLTLANPPATATAAQPASSASSTPLNLPSAATASIQATWLGGVLGDEPQTLSASWWLTSPFFGATLPGPAGADADRYRVIRFLADHCPQLEGRVAPNAWTRCTSYDVAEPGTGSLAALALLLACASGPLNARRRRRLPAPS